MIAVSNTSPLILLEKAGYLSVLGKLFEKLIIPPEVDKEWLRPGNYVVPDWLCVSSLSDDAVSYAENLYRKMDKGEAEAIALFSEIKANFLLLDDLKGRRYADYQGLPIVGTVGLLITAKKKGLISELRPVLEILKTQKIRLSDDVFRKALMLANESE